MTERLYFNTDQLNTSTSVISCSPSDNGQFAVVLQATLFHPQGGGQPADVGMIGPANVLHVQQDGEMVVHMTDQAVAAGEIFIEVSAGPRQLHARLHSAGHLLGYCGEQYGWKAVKGHHWPGEARVVFEATATAQAIDIETIAAQAHTLLLRNLPRKIIQDEHQRMISFGDLPATCCGGTHVASLVQIGKIKIVKIKQKKELLSIHYTVEELP
ncbi:Ser-tRNA(Ala) deacylase AlaX [Herbaspirillum sp. Sphag1AN]|uniref:alanyl-tRNA editing protein n=1 Tax=unclassified Herbaspirillum TaxID=2624150 RepID=UPI00161C6786|nr:MULTISPECIES: alanyl-tRNA editing protein [unclassified Herbaspirillum]MBB3214698.1 Ser-tRNA(Ala) deacylase AlaX [Herbaspirillum sp. Sphag1AN]MBB3247899.1 Ser-tRNA(Ala) deacylase AlaX [Herbaspirillum sp. Sphag64]